MIDKNLSRLDGDFFRIEKSRKTTSYSNLCYWLGFAKPGLLNQQPDLRKVKFAMSLQYSREGQVWREGDNCLGDPSFCEENAELFAPVQCAGRYSPFPDLSTLLPTPSILLTDVTMKPMALVIWDFYHVNPAAVEVVASRGSKQKRLVDLLSVLGEQPDRAFFLFAIPGWSEEVVEMKFASHTETILRKKGGFRFVDRGTI